MANKRNLKRAIHFVCDQLLTEAIAIGLYGTDTQKANAESHIFAIAKTEYEFISRVSHPEPGMKAKAYYEDLIEKFNAQISDILDQMNG